jgi:hypothetical protein
MHYTVFSLRDGTITSACPMRKPARRILKRDGLRVDADGVTIEYCSAGRELSDGRYEGRFRFQNIIATSLNTRRAIREMVLPPIAEMRAEISALRAEVERLNQALAEVRRG